MVGSSRKGKVEVERSNNNERKRSVKNYEKTRKHSKF